MNRITINTHNIILLWYIFIFKLRTEDLAETLISRIDSICKNSKHADKLSNMHQLNTYVGIRYLLARMLQHFALFSQLVYGPFR
jgi:hypothetical protein